MGIGLRPHFDVADARLVAGRADDTSAGPASAADIAEGPPLRRFVPSGQPLIIEYNPTRPRGRLRYSVAHELAHALFPDASEEVRNRTHTGAVEALAEDDSWQLELLCNVAAAELLMPTDAIEGLANSDTNIDFLMTQRAKFNVSTEALLRRLVHATDRPIALAAFSRLRDSRESDMRCEYVLGSRTWRGSLARGAVVGSDTVLAVPMAIGQTAHGIVPLPQPDGDAVVQAVGIPPYPRSRMPRVLALVEPMEAVAPSGEGIRFITHDLADALRGPDDPENTAAGKVVIAHGRVRRGARVGEIRCRRDAPAASSRCRAGIPLMVHRGAGEPHAGECARAGRARGGWFDGRGREHGRATRVRAKRDTAAVIRRVGRSAREGVRPGSKRRR